MKSRQTIFITIFTLLVSFKTANAQFWAQGLGGNEVDEVMDICRDGAGNIYSAGYFTNQVEFGTSVTHYRHPLEFGYFYSEIK